MPLRLLLFPLADGTGYQAFIQRWRIDNFPFCLIGMRLLYAVEQSSPAGRTTSPSSTTRLPGQPRAAGPGAASRQLRKLRLLLELRSM